MKDTSVEAVILAAGLGSRMRPLTDQCQKGLLSVGGESIVGRQIRLLKEAGIEEENICIVTGYKASKYEDKYRKSDVELVENTEYRETDNLESFLLSKDFCSEGSDLLVLNGDVLFQKELIQKVLSEKGSVYPVDTRPDSHAIKVEIQEGRVVDILGKDADFYHGCTIGVFKIGAGDCSRIFSAGEEVSSEKKGKWFESCIDASLSDLVFRAVDITGLFWDELDTPKEFLRAKIAVEKQGIGGSS